MIHRPIPSLEEHVSNSKGSTRSGKAQVQTKISKAGKRRVNTRKGTIKEKRRGKNTLLKLNSQSKEGRLRLRALSERENKNNNVAEERGIYKYCIRRVKNPLLPTSPHHRRKKSPSKKRGTHRLQKASTISRAKDPSLNFSKNEQQTKGDEKWSYG